MNKIRAILIGDVVGPLGCAMFQKHIAKLKEEHKADLVIVNGENSSARGRGITSKIMNFFKHNHANIVTSGNHIWAEKEIYSYLENNKDLFYLQGGTLVPRLYYRIYQAFLFALHDYNR